MADEDVNKAKNFMNTLNTLAQSNNVENLDDLLSKLLESSISTPPAEELDLNDVEAISCEYNDLNNTIDELNSYLDVWEERHNNLRAKIREALSPEQDETENVDQESPPSDSNGATGSDHKVKGDLVIQERKPSTEQQQRSDSSSKDL